MSSSDDRFRLAQPVGWAAAALALAGLVGSVLFAQGEAQNNRGAAPAAYAGPRAVELARPWPNHAARPVQTAAAPEAWHPARRVPQPQPGPRLAQRDLQAPPPPAGEAASPPIAEPRAVEPLPAVAPEPAAGAGGESNRYRLRNVDAAQFEAALARLFRQAPTVTVSQDGRSAAYQFTSARGSRSTLTVDRATAEVSVSGSPALAESWLRVAQALDRGDNDNRQRDRQTAVMPLGRSDRNAVHKVLTALALEQNAQPGAERAAPAQPVPPPAAQPGAAPRPADDGQGNAALIGPVQIEFLEGLDMIVIRGHPRDVQRVTEIINDIERLSAETKPSIEFYALKNLTGDTMASMVRQLYEQVLSTRAGRVTITPLGKPNVLLVIGREESVKTVIELIKQLDQPVAPESQFKAFALQHISAGAAQQTVQDFFSSRTGLGARPILTADTRSNTLFVQAGARDIAEVAAVLKRIDTPTSSAVNLLRIFPLQHTLADDLASVLQAAVSGQSPQAGQQGRRGQQQQQQQQQQQPNLQNFFQPGGQQQPGQPGGPFGQQQQQQQQQADQRGQGQGSAARSAVLQFLTTDAQGQRILKSGVLADVRITADSRANAVLISAPAESMELLAALVKQLDQPPAIESQLKVFTVMNGDATSLSDMLQNLFGQRSAPGQGPGGDGDGAADGSTIVPLRFSVDPRTNSIIVSGSASDLAVVEAVLLKLDDSDVQERKSKVYRLKNAPAPDVANSINQFLSSERQVQQVQPGLASPFEQIQREVVVVPEPVSNSLIVSATPRYYEEIRRIVEDLDARPPMVMIQVLIAEVALNNTDEFGIELGLQDSVLFDRSLLGDLVQTTTTTTFGDPPTTTQTQNIVGASNTPGYNFNNQALGNSGSDKSLSNSGAVGGQGLSHFAVGRINNELGFGGMVLSASSENVSVLIRALNEARRVDILSRPQVMALDNQPAYIQLGQRVPRITAAQFTEVGQINSVTLENVGLILLVQPRVSPDGLVSMYIQAEKSEVGPEQEGIPITVAQNGTVIRSPRINLTQAQTVVSALSGQTVVLGGLIVTNKSQIHRRVPGLADIPLLGNLFRYDSISNRRSELLIIMTPRVVRNERDAEIIKQTEASRMHWCLSDVIKLHGESGLRSRFDEWGHGETITVFPDVDPNGTAAPTEVIPAPEGQQPPQGMPPGAPQPNVPPPPTPGAPIEPLGQPLLQRSPAPGAQRPQAEPIQAAGGALPPPAGAVQAAVYQPLQTAGAPPIRR